MHNKQEGQALKEQGIALALEHAGEAWKVAALNKVREYCAAGQLTVFAFEDVRAWTLANGLPPPPSAKAWGGIGQAAVRAGIIVATGDFRPAVSALTHGHPVRLYRAGSEGR